MDDPTDPRTNRPAYTDIPPASRHDGSIEGFRRQRRLALRRDLEGEEAAREGETRRTH